MNIKTTTRVIPETIAFAVLSWLPKIPYLVIIAILAMVIAEQNRLEAQAELNRKLQAQANISAIDLSKCKVTGAGETILQLECQR